MTRIKPAYFVIEVPIDNVSEAYPETLFSCQTLGEALDLCKRMNKDAGYPKFGVHGKASDPMTIGERTAQTSSKDAE